MRLQLNPIPHLPNENTLATNNLQIQKRKRLQERKDVLRSVTFVVDDSAVLENALAMVQNGTEGTPRKFQVLLLKMASLFDRVLFELFLCSNVVVFTQAFSRGIYSTVVRCSNKSEDLATQNQFARFCAKNRAIQGHRC